MQDRRPAGARTRSLAARLAVVAAVLAVLYALRPGLVENGLRSPRVWATVVLVLVAGRLVAFAVRRTTGRARAGAVAGNLVLAVIGAVLLAPSFQQRSADEPFPEITRAAAGDAPPSAGSDVPVPPAAGTAAPSPSTPAPAGPAPAAADPVPVASGALEGVGHAASGQVVLYTVGDQLVVRFEDVDIEGTPGPYVHLVRVGSRTPEGGLELGTLTAERGTFGYVLPPDVDASASWTVLVWCRPFATPVAAADLAVA